METCGEISGWDAGNVLYYWLNGSYTDVYICKNLSNYTLKTCKRACM